MAERVVLHVGAMKSGTSFVQDQLFANRDLLAERGVQLPGRKWDDQVLAVTEVLGRRAGGLGDNTGTWARLVEEVRAHDGTAVVSMEFLGPAGPPTIQRVLGDLGPVTVVVTARDLNRSIPAMWQETVQNGRSWTFAEYVEGVRRARPRPNRPREDVGEAGRTFWRQQNLVRICRAWQASPGGVVLATVPGPGAPRDLLMRRFAEAAGFDPAGLVEPRRANESLGVASTLALRRLNEVLSERGRDYPYGAHVRKQRLAKRILAARRPDEAPIGLPVADWVRAHSARTVAALRDHGVRLVGEWSDLDPVEVPGTDPDAVPEADVAEAAIAGLAGLVADAARSRR